MRGCVCARSANVYQASRDTGRRQRPRLQQLQEQRREQLQAKQLQLQLRPDLSIVQHPPSFLLPSQLFSLHVSNCTQKDTSSAFIPQMRNRINSVYSRCQQPIAIEQVYNQMARNKWLKPASTNDKRRQLLQSQVCTIGSWQHRRRHRRWNSIRSKNNNYNYNYSIEQQSYKLALLYSSIQRLKTTHTFNLASHDLLSDLIFNQNTLDVKAVKLIQHNQSKQIMLRPATCFKATSIIQDWCYLHTFSHFVNTTTNANVQRRFNSVLATNTTAFSEETDMETNAKSEQHTKSPISSDRLVPLSSRIRASSTQLKLPTTPNTIPSFKRIPIDNKLRPNTSFIQQPAHPSSRTKQQLVDELRDILTCPSATVNTMWHAYTNVARWRGSLALLKKADFKAILGLLRGSDKHTAKLDHHEQDISDNYQSANLMHSQHQHRQGQVIVKRIMKVIRDMRLTKKRLPAHEYASLLTVCAYYQVPAAAEKLFKQCQEDLAPAPPPPGVYTAMMSTCLRLQRWDRVVDLFKQLIHVNWTPTNAQCNMTLRAYIEQDDYLNAQQLFKAMQHGTLPNTLLSSEPASSIPNSIDINGTSVLTSTSSIALNSLNYQADIVTYNIWIAADIAAGHWSKAVERLEQMEQFGSPSPDKRTFYLLLKCYAQRNDQHGFMRIWHRLTQLDDGIDESVCKLALRLLEHRMSPVEAVNALFQQLPSINRHDVDSSDGQALARRMMMRALVRERASTSAYDQKRADFLRLYNESTTEMHDKASYDTTNIAMRGLLRYHASPKEMGQLIQWMDMNHVEMNASQWLWLLAYANRRNQPDDKQTSTRNHLSAYLRSFAWDQYALRRDTTGYNRLLSSVLVDSRLLAKDDRYSAGYSLLAAMKQDGHAITPKTLSLLATESTDIQMLNELWHLAFKSTNVSSMPAFISSFARLGQVDIARQLFGQLRANSKNHLPIQLYLQLMQAYRQSGSILNVRRMHRLLLVDGYWPNLIGMTILTDTRARFGRPISVRQVLRQLKTQQLQADLPLITVLLRSSLRHADLSAVGYLLNIMKQQKMKPDARFMTSLLAGYSRLQGEQGVETAFQILHQLQRESSTIKARETELSLNTVHWNAVLSGVIGRHDPTLSMADRVLDSMIKSSTKPKEANRHFLVDTHTSVSTATTAIPMHKMPTPSLRTFKIVMGAHARYKRWWAVIRWWRRWQQYLKQNSLYDTTNVKICPDTIAYSMAIQALKAVGRLQEAQRLVDDATKQGLLRNT